MAGGLLSTATAPRGKGSRRKSLMFVALLHIAVMVGAKQVNKSQREPERLMRKLPVQEGVCGVYVDATDTQEMITPSDIFAKNTTAFPPGFVW